MKYGAAEAWLGTTLLIGALLASAAARAGPVALGEVVVTARHRTEDAQKVPAALQVVGGELLETTNSSNLGQIAQFVPSLQFNFFNDRNTAINIRGIGANIGITNDGLEPGVGFYVDQVYYGRPGQATLDLIDVDRIEILRGPQGTLFGKNSTAGAVVVNTAAPSFTPGVVGEATGGDYGYFQARASLNGPIVDHVLAARLAVATTSRGGLLTNTYGGVDHAVNASRALTLRGQLLWTPSLQFRIRLIADYGRQYSNCCDQVLVGSVKPPGVQDFVAAAATFGFTPVFNPFARRADTNSPFKAIEESGGVSAAADWSLSKFTVTSVTAWRFWNWWPTNDNDFTPLSIVTKGQTSNYQRQFSQELRIASSGVNRIDYVGGLYLLHEHLDAVLDTAFGNAATYFFFGPGLPSLVLDGYGVHGVSKYDITSAAAFGQVVWHFTRKLDLTGGLRWTYDAKSGTADIDPVGGVPLTGPLAYLQPYRLAIDRPVDANLAARNGNLSGQVNVSFQLTDNILGYANYARGSKSGGLNLGRLPVSASRVIQPEFIDSIEGGVKTRLMGGRMVFNADYFWQRDSDYQANLFNPVASATYLSNIPEVRSEGVEIDAAAQPVSNLGLYASGAWDDATYARYPAGPCGLEFITRPFCNLSGSPLAGVPRWSVSAGGEVAAPVKLGARGAEAYFGLDYHYRSSLFSDATDSVFTRLGGLNLVNARVGIRSGDGRWDLDVWIRNLADAHYFTFISPGLGDTGLLTGQLGDPRTYGVTLRVRN